MTIFYLWIDNIILTNPEHFINWMAMETFSGFRKLWGRIDEELDIDVYSVEVEDSNLRNFPKIFFIFNKIIFIKNKKDYNTSQFNSNKSMIISTTNSMGQSRFFGWALVIGAVYCFFITIILWIILMANSSKKFDYSNMKWN